MTIILFSRQKAIVKSRTIILIYCFSYTWQPTPVLLPGKFHGQRSLVGYSPWGRKESDTTEQLHFNVLYIYINLKHMLSLWYILHIYIFHFKQEILHECTRFLNSHTFLKIGFI